MNKGINTTIQEANNNIAVTVNNCLSQLPPAIVSLILKDAYNQVDSLCVKAVLEEKSSADKQNCAEAVQDEGEAKTS